MKVVLQRVSQASVTVDQKELAKISQGYVLLVGIHKEDTPEEINYLVNKISKLRVFEDEEGRMNRSLQDVAGEILSVSQFTLLASTKKGNRPSFTDAANPAIAVPLYELFNQGLREAGYTVKTGEFGADMAVSLVNDGPVTIIYDTKQV